MSPATAHGFCGNGEERRATQFFDHERDRTIKNPPP
jgi:hypothetical protein